MLKKLIQGFKDSVVSQKFEADLYPVGAPKKGSDFGEVEFVQFQQGHAKLEVEIKRKAGIPEGD